MVDENELIEAASALLAEAASAWSCYATAKALFAYQTPNGPVSNSRFEELQIRLAAYYGNAVSAFGASDRALRAALARKGEMPEPAAPEAMVLVREAARAQCLGDATLAMFTKHIAGSGNLAAVDNHGAEWLLRFLTSFGYPASLAIPPSETAH